MGMKGFKGFEKDFSCKVKQYEENTTYEEHGVGCCHKGVMHFCEDPWEVLNHYDLVDENGNFSEFAEVEALGQVWNDGEKRATNKIHKAFPIKNPCPRGIIGYFYKNNSRLIQ